MRVFESRTFESLFDRDSASTFADMEFRQCYFEGCAFTYQEPAFRTTVRNVRLIDCSQQGSAMECAIVEDVLVDGFNTRGQVFQLFGAVFNRVVLRGNVDRIMITNDVFPTRGKDDIAAFRVANAEYYRSVDWALDISQGEFKELDIRGVPTHLIRRDPATQVVVTRQKAEEGRWRDLEFNEGLWPISLALFLQIDEFSTSKVLVAPKQHRKFRRYLEDLQLLREAGVAEPG